MVVLDPRVGSSDQNAQQVVRLQSSTKRLANSSDPIAHKQLLIEIRDWQQRFLLVFSDQQLHLYSTEENQYDCMISGDIDTLMALQNPAMLTQLIRQDKLDLQGDLNIAQGFSNAFAAMDVD